MSTTVTYKGSTLTTVDNQTRTLKTAGKYMEGDVILTDVSNSGGYVTQDQNGFIILPPNGDGSPSVGGLEYEEGTWTPSEDVASYVIPFSNTHTEAPFYYTITDVTGTYDSTSNTGIIVSYSNSHQLFGESFYINTTSSLYGFVYMRYRSTNATSSSQYNVVITRPYTSTDDSSVDCSRYWAKETGIVAFLGDSTRYFRAGRTYKWIAVWAPTT